jgi:hypothetical protein
MFDSKGILTETQEFLEACPMVHTMLQNLSDYLSYVGCVDYAVLLNVILMRTPAVRRYGIDSPARGKLLRQVLSEDPWSAYAAFADEAGLSL